MDFVNDCVWMFESAGGLKQNPARQRMAPVPAVKVLLATRPRALLRSTLTAQPSAKMRRYDFVVVVYFFKMAFSGW